MIEKRPDQHKWLPEQQAAADEVWERTAKIGANNVKAKIIRLQDELANLEPGTEHFNEISDEIHRLSSWIPPGQLEEIFDDVSSQYEADQIVKDKE